MKSTSTPSGDRHGAVVADGLQERDRAKGVRLGIERQRRCSASNTSGDWRSPRLLPECGPSRAARCGTGPVCPACRRCVRGSPVRPVAEDSRSDRGGRASARPRVMSDALTGRSCQFRSRSSLSPWNKPQSTSTFAVPVSSRCFDPVTVCAAPRNVSFSSPILITISSACRRMLRALSVALMHLRLRQASMSLCGIHLQTECSITQTAQPVRRYARTTPCRCP